MKVRLYKRNEEELVFEFPYVKEWVARLRQIKRCRWNPELRAWTIPYTLLNVERFVVLFGDIDYLVELALQEECHLLSGEISDGKNSNKKGKVGRKTVDFERSSWNSYTESLLVYQLKLRGYSPRTIKAYCGHVSRLYRYYREHPELSVLDLVSQFSYFLLSRKLSHAYVNQAISGVEFYLEEVCDSLEGSYSYIRPKKEKKLPNVLGKREVMKLLSVIQNRKHQAIFYLIYSSGLRVGEVVRLRLGDIDRERKTLHIRQGKGRKDRLTVLSDLALTVIQSYIDGSRPEGWLFPGQQPGSHLTERTVQKVFEQALKAASINKEVSVHALRHSFATHLLEDGIDIRYIQEFLGHKSTRTTEIYTHVAVKDVRRIMSPLDRIVESSQD